ncbi:PTS system, nitrogen regulatory IIA component [Candidatus Kinetoplastibacterium desouzaii TCC079E]|uniref:PTS system, nitrogen regulatory IIA component n=1 Tax=Candidatus Kinetoplastidibacterium desouzai TCC079E TaxID=1208919 RepID=M1L379_9PROT|nr:PTS sugar transporter subunit IIA [Candidatus Kinetoplastibacterium desouzaii]AGF47203.1 PTS system, nitrogen regulatory IIA component [Candidatus Kinetoplastibacterium desouzaii TCC079E]
MNSNFLFNALPIDNILLEMSATSKKRAFENISLFFERKHDISSSAVFKSLLAREKIGSTYIGNNLAIPHGYVYDLKKTIAAFVRLNRPIIFYNQNRQLVNTLMFFLVPLNQAEEHIKILTKLTSNLLDKTTNKILQTEDKKIIYNTIIKQKL